MVGKNMNWRNFNMSKNIFEKFQNQYSISKTLRNELKPCGKTLYYMEERGLLTEDEERAENYKIVKTMIDEYHKNFISESLQGIVIPSLDEYRDLYLSSKDDNTKKQLTDLGKLMRVYIVQRIKENPKFNTLFKKELITKDLQEYFEGDEREKILEQFSRFSTYFTNFHENRKNMYDAEEKSTAIAYRIINQNLPKFIDNMRVFDIVLNSPLYEQILEMEEDYKELLQGKSIRDCFTIESYSNTITNEQIAIYNTIIGGISEEGKKKIKGLNEYINLHNQKNSKDKEYRKIPKFTMLYKQILADRETFSFIAEQFKNDQEVIDTVRDVVNELMETVLKESGTGSIFELMRSINNYDISKIYVSNDVSITNISNALYGDWAIIKDAMEKEYDAGKLKAKKNDKYFEKRSKELKKKKYLSIEYLNNVVEEYIGEFESIQQYFSDFTITIDIHNRNKDESSKREKINCYDLLSKSYKEAYDEGKGLLCCSEYSSKYGLKGDKESIRIIKNLLDSIKYIEQFIKPLLVKGEESNVDYAFYGELNELYNKLSVITPLYNKVRNYVTQKPYSTEKIKLNFENPQLLGGWDKNKECDYRTVLLIKDMEYYLAIMDKRDNKILLDPPIDEIGDGYKKIEYKLLPGPNKMLPKVFFAASNIEHYSPSEEICSIREKESFKKGENFNISDCHKFIDFFKDSINIHEDWSQFGFDFTPTKDYKDISQFYKEVEQQGYTIKFKNISRTYIDDLVEEGKLYLFKIYNKDFSKYSKGKPNLHTIYLKMLFDERNLSNVVYKLNGEAEMFYRKASIDKENRTVHKKGIPIENKNPKTEKKTSVFEYDLIKDKHYTLDKFQLHLPITLNFCAIGNKNINSMVLDTIRENDDIYVIGVDRGERNLLYISVIDSDGKIVEQESLNIIKSDNGYEQDYHLLLDKKEKGRTEARKNWDTIETIKELKEGYLSQVIHKIAEYMLKYNAIVVLEDLNFGFKNSRIKVEKQVYQKFEKMLIDKLNYLVDKKKDVEELGGALHAYQLTNEFESFSKLGKQSGFLFYIPAWNTSKIDPTTGFVNLIHFKYSNMDDAKDKISKFKKISYNGEYFEFDIDYNDFTEKANGTRTKWTLCSYGTRIVNSRDAEKNSMWTSKEVNISDEIMELLLKYDIDINKDNLIEQIVRVEEADFYKKLFYYINLVLQIRNSMINSDVDYMISPVKNNKGEFFDTRNYSVNSYLPCDADANGAYNIARKGLWLMEQIRNTEGDKVAISNKEWLNYAQENVVL